MQRRNAGVAELVDAPGLGPGGESCAGSSPVTRTRLRERIFVIDLNLCVVSQLSFNSRCNLLLREFFCKLKDPLL